MESRTVEPDKFGSLDGVSDALEEAVEEEMGFLESEDRDLKLVRARENDEGEVQQVTVQAGDEMYRLSEVAPGNVSRTVFRNPPRDDAVPYTEGDGGDATAEEEEPEGDEGEEGGGAGSDASDDGDDEEV